MDGLVRYFGKVTFSNIEVRSKKVRGQHKNNAVLTFGNAGKLTFVKYLPVQGFFSCNFNIYTHRDLRIFFFFSSISVDDYIKMKKQKKPPLQL
jgi:hypothetical protein